MELRRKTNAGVKKVMISAGLCHRNNLPGRDRKREADRGNIKPMAGTTGIDVSGKRGPAVEGGETRKQKKILKFTTPGIGRTGGRAPSGMSGVAINPQQNMRVSG